MQNRKTDKKIFLVFTLHNFRTSLGKMQVKCLVLVLVAGVFALPSSLPNDNTFRFARSLGSNMVLQQAPAIVCDANKIVYKINTSGTRKRQREGRAKVKTDDVLGEGSGESKEETRRRGCCFLCCSGVPVALVRHVQALCPLHLRPAMNLSARCAAFPKIIIIKRQIRHVSRETGDMFPS